VTQPQIRVIRFGEYELDLESSELRKHGHKVPLPEQALQILAMLLERPGEIIPREQLIARLWPGATVVEFDHGINSSVRRLRAVLNDSAERPRYIETRRAALRIDSLDCLHRRFPVWLITLCI